jgi:hypothetical protein
VTQPNEFVAWFMEKRPIKSIQMDVAYR